MFTSVATRRNDLVVKLLAVILDVAIMLFFTARVACCACTQLLRISAPPSAPARCFHASGGRFGDVLACLHWMLGYRGPERPPSNTSTPPHSLSQLSVTSLPGSSPGSPLRHGSGPRPTSSPLRHSTPPRTTASAPHPRVPWVSTRALSPSGRARPATLPLSAVTGCSTRVAPWHCPAAVVAAREEARAARAAGGNISPAAITASPATTDETRGPPSPCRGARSVSSDARTYTGLAAARRSGGGAGAEGRLVASDGAVSDSASFAVAVMSRSGSAAAVPTGISSPAASPDAPEAAPPGPEGDAQRAVVVARVLTKRLMADLAARTAATASASARPAFPESAEPGSEEENERDTADSSAAGRTQRPPPPPSALASATGTTVLGGRVPLWDGEQLPWMTFVEAEETLAAHPVCAALPSFSALSSRPPWNPLRVGGTAVVGWDESTPFGNAARQLRHVMFCYSVRL